MPTFYFTAAIKELDAQIRGRLIIRLLIQLEHEDEGSFVFAGWIVSFTLDRDNVCWVGMQEGFLWNPGALNLSRFTSASRVATSSPDASLDGPSFETGGEHAASAVAINGRATCATPLPGKRSRSGEV